MTDEEETIEAFVDSIFFKLKRELGKEGFQCSRLLLQKLIKEDIKALMNGEW